MVQSVILPKLKDKPIDLTVSKPSNVSVLWTRNAVFPRNKYNLYSLANSDKNDFSQEFFSENIKELIERTSKSMESCKLAIPGDPVKDVIEEIIKKPDEISLSDDKMSLLSVLNGKHIRDQYAFFVLTHELRESMELKDATSKSFLVVKGFKELPLVKQQLILNNWLRRFFVTLHIRWVELKPAAANESKKEESKEPQLLSNKLLKEKEEKIVHHLGGYILKKILRRFDQPKLLERCISEDGGKSNLYSSWSKRLSRGGLIILKPQAFELFKLMNNLVAPVFEQSILKDNTSRKAMVFNTLKTKSVLDRWNNLWGDSNDKDKEKCLNIIIDTLCNSRAKALQDFYKRKINKARSDVFLPLRVT